MLTATRAPIVAALLSVCCAAHGAQRPTMLHVRAYSDVAAAEECLAHGFPWMVRIGPDDVICTISAAGIEKAVRTRDVVDAAVRAMRGR